MCEICNKLDAAEGGVVKGILGNLDSPRRVSVVDIGKQVIGELVATGVDKDRERARDVMRLMAIVKAYELFFQDNLPGLMKILPKTKEGVDFVVEAVDMLSIKDAILSASVEVQEKNLKGFLAAVESDARRAANPEQRLDPEKLVEELSKVFGGPVNVINLDDLPGMVKGEEPPRGMRGNVVSGDLSGNLPTKEETQAVMDKIEAANEANLHPEHQSKQ
jgi:hypothetical protein